MFRYRLYSLVGVAALLLGACTSNNDVADAFGNFEATEVIVSAEASGKILELNINEGDVFEEPQQVGLVDSLQLSLQKQQLEAQSKAIASGIRNVLSRIEVEKEQQAILMKDKMRIEQMFKEGASTQKQVDDVNGNLSLIESRIQAIKTENAKILSQLEGLDRQIDLLEDQISKCKIGMPMSATVLEKYMEEYEFVKAGTPLFKIADLQKMELRVYVSGEQLPHIKLGQIVEIQIDDTAGSNRELQGKITWIASQAEFTPKIIQTKKERVKLVYAVKIMVENDGSLKIGMPGEVRFN